MALIPTSQKRPFIPAPGVAQLEAVYTYLGQKVENVYHFQKGSLTTPYDQASMDALAAGFEAWEHNRAISVRDIASTLTLIRVRDMSEAAGVVREYTPTTAVTGTQTGDSLPANVTIAVKWLTRLGGRSFRGRTFHIGFPFNFQSGNQVTPAGRASLQDRYTLLLSDLVTSAGSSLSVVSFSHNKFWRTTAVTTPIVSCSIDPNLDSQRRRLTGRGT